ncbi:GAF domain-containing sensor histidine kinase [Colwellia piezophila]|uniref:GAF domain-containing sensor histidine kinase n=1 Tax=Colwellia piezophila TaxID=211668 RepID=UPI0003759AD4|nr:GAF domain-containing sensor histidine kinase [Colwellia piezophila]
MLTLLPLIDAWPYGEDSLHNQIYQQLIDSWNKTLAVVAKLAEVPVALVMRVEQDKISVFSKNDHSENPYNIGDSDILNSSGLYCEHVIKSQQQLHIPNALIDEKWQNNPDIKLNMVAYLGLPIVDGDGCPFGTICILDNKEHVFSETIMELLAAIKHSFELQLRQLHFQRIEDEKQQLEDLAMLIRGISHEINTPLGVGITTTSVIESNIEKIQQKLKEKSLSQKNLTNCLNTMQEGVKILSKSLETSAEKVTILRELLANDFETTSQSIALYPLVIAAQDKYKKELNSLQVKYNIEHNEHLDTQAFISAELFLQVLLILCKNSLEHGLVGIDNPEIEVKFKNYPNVIKLHYLDNGKGIDKSDHKKIFSPFYSTNRISGCSGLGLSIAKSIITQQLHGEISIEESAIGVHFVISLPKAAAPTAS